MKLTPWEPDLKTVVERIESGDIDLQPDFQRQEIWSPAKKRRLIDTVLRGWSIPPVFLVVTKDGRMEVLDGQQRLAALRDFVRNDFSIDGSITPPDDRIQSLDGKYYRRLDPADKRLLDQYTLRCFRITDYLPDEPSELFYRLNQPSMLTAGEQRNAFYGPAREQLKNLVRFFESGDNNKKTIGFSNARLAYDDIVARLLLFLEAKTFATKSTEALVSQRFKDRSEFSGDVLAQAQKSIDHFSRSRKEALAVRLNKASTLSWLLFFARFENDEPSHEYMTSFVQSASTTSARNFVPQAYAVFQDRASLRVTDVSSVVYRDAALWFAYYFSGHLPLPETVDRQTLIAIRDDLQSREDTTFEHSLAQRLNLERWSKLP
ncbi:DUF262 domain-containing protein [Bradyrhizobium mercantei]|uniref:DUF262 domain-containing protein n=1 Tax=Bradyrhizobium mercantei TaxID=1904807 RepID=UPI00097654E9|nr:DUF262 domain-containing protein [Bradyrhizobium mercantei]